MSVLIVGSIGLDTVKTPVEEHANLLGGSASYASLAASFAMAAVVTGEVDRWHPGLTRIVGPVAYGGAALVGVARMYQNVHWASDLPLAAAIGTWSGITVLARSHSRRDRLDAQARDLSAGLVNVLRATSVVPIAGHGAALSWSIPVELGSRSHGR